MGRETPPYSGKRSPPPREGDDRRSGGAWGSEVDRRIAALASRQHGVVSAAQLHGLGLTARGIEARLRSGRLFRLHRGVYAVGHTALTARGRDLAAVFACGPGALLSHRSAANVWGLLRSASPRIEVTSPRGRRPRGGITLHRSRSIHADDVAEVDAIPVTSVARTLVDLADVVGRTRLECAVNEAEVLRVFDLGALQAACDRRPGRHGAGRLTDVLQTYAPEPRFVRSKAERRLLRLCKEHGLPAPQTNTWIEEQEVDAFWPDARLAIEFDGRRFHTTRRAFEEDRRRDRRLAALGIQVNRITWRDFEDAAGLAAELMAIRARRLDGT